jgi:sensor c-di-GMP phosphodiesterase-like protein
MEESKVEMAIYIIKNMIAKEINENTEADYTKFKEKIQKLREEQHEIYIGNEEVINKVLTEYAEKIKH